MLCTQFIAPDLVFDSFPGIGIVLHYLSGANFTIYIDLPENDALVFGCSKGIVFYCLFHVLTREMFTKKADEVRIS
jgi:hypothetical protein